MAYYAGDSREEEMTGGELNEAEALRLKVFQERLRKREIWLNGVIDDGLVEKLYVNLIKLEEASPKEPIIVVINSYGGLANEAAVATDIMTTVSCPIKTVATANALSAGFVIFMGGSERICHDNTTFMMHDASFWINDKISVVRDIVDYMEKAQEKMAKFLSRQTGGKTSPEYWTELFKSGKEKWFTLEEALDLGIVHKVVRRNDENPDNVPPNTWNIPAFGKMALR